MALSRGAACAILATVCVGAFTPARGGGVGGVGGEEPAAMRYHPTLLVQLGVADLDRSVAFYTRTMGFTLESRDDDLEWARINPGIPGVTIGLGRVDEVMASDSISLNLGVEDLEAARAVLEARGVEFLGPSVKIPGVVQLADLRDPDGHKIRLAAHPPGFGAHADAPAEVDDPLAAFAWLEGEWHGEHGSRAWEEHWSRPEGGAIVGMFRMTNKGKPVVYEILLIEAGEGEPVYRLRHFGSEMKAWEEEPLTFDLVEADEGHVLFKNRDAAHGPTYIRYTRTGSDRADAWVGGTAEPGGEGFTLAMRRAGG